MRYTLFLLLLCIASFGYSQTLSDNIDISGSTNGIVALPSSAPAAFRNAGFVKYTKIQAPNGQAIHFVMQNAVTDAQAVRARNILKFYLTNVPGSQYGTDKTAVINAMGTNEALLLLMNGSDTGNGPNLPGQPLYQNEMAVEGHSWYINNNYEHRDAAYEEILHLMHDMGIGVDNNGTPSPIGALPAFQTEIRAAQENADNNNFQIWPLGARTDPSWYNELAQENSLSQEYLASVVDSYYGLWEPWTESTEHGMWGEYISKTREEIQTEDPMGWAVMSKYFSPMININMDIDPSFTGVFNMTRTPAQPYTYKSQYLQHCTLTGSNASGLKGNAHYNVLIGNNSNNTLEGGMGNDRLDGKGGSDKAIFTGASTEYIITADGDKFIIADQVANRDGVDTLVNIEIGKYTDKEAPIEASMTTPTEEVILKSNAIELWPNPTDNDLKIKLESGDYTIRILDAAGAMHQTITLTGANPIHTIDITALPAGAYFVQMINTADPNDLHIHLMLKQ